MKVTQKNVQVHIECTCGHNSVDHYPISDTWRSLRKANMKPTKQKDGTYCFFLYFFLPKCQCLPERQLRERMLDYSAYDED